MSSQTLRLELSASESVAAIRERLSHLRRQRVLLVLPEDGAVLRRRLDLVLIQREAHRRLIQLALISRDPAVTALAGELNISCFPSIEASERARWKRGRQKVFLPRHHKPGKDLGPEDLARIADRIASRRRRSPWRSALQQLLVLLLLAASLGAAMYVILPGARVDVRLRQERVVVIVDIVADRKADGAKPAEGLIPARTIRQTVESSATMPTTGEFRLDSAVAAGVVTFTNLGEARARIPKGAVLSTSAGEPILFETVAEAIVPAGAGGRVEATVQAMAGYGGSIGNVGAGMINTLLGALAERVSVINLQPIAGGGARSVPIVDQADQRRLLESLRIQLQSLAFEKMRAGLSPSQVIVIESIRIDDERKDWMEYSADIGAMTSELSLTMRAVVSALIIDERFGAQVALERLRAELRQDTRLLADSVEYSRGPFGPGPRESQIAFTATSSGTVAAVLDEALLRERLAGAGLDEARTLLASLPQLSGDFPARITLYPEFLERMPLLPLRIDLRLRGAA